MTFDFIEKKDLPESIRNDRKDKAIIEILDNFFTSEAEVVKITCNGMDGNYSSPRAASTMIHRILKRKGISNFRLAIKENEDTLYIIKE